MLTLKLMGENQTVDLNPRAVESVQEYTTSNLNRGTVVIMTSGTRYIVEERRELILREIIKEGAWK